MFAGNFRELPTNWRLNLSVLAEEIASGMRCAQPCDSVSPLADAGRCSARGQCRDGFDPQATQSFGRSPSVSV